MFEVRPRRGPSPLGPHRGLSRWEKTRQLSLRPAQIPQVRKALKRYQVFKQSLEAISELNQFLLRLDREATKEQERQS